MGVTRFERIAAHIGRVDGELARMLAMPAPLSWGSWLGVRGRLQVSRRDLEAASVLLASDASAVVFEPSRSSTGATAATLRPVVERSRVDRVAVAARRVELNLDVVEAGALLRAVSDAIEEGDGSIGHLQALDRIHQRLQPRVARARAATRL